MTVMALMRAAAETWLPGSDAESNRPPRVPGSDAFPADPRRDWRPDPFGSAEPGRFVLIVDDDPAIRETVADALSFEGYQVVTASNGREAIDRIEFMQPCLVLLDMRMPILDGWGVAEELKRRNIDVPILVLTAARSAKNWAAEIGAATYLAKPFELDALIEQVRRFC